MVLVMSDHPLVHPTVDALELPAVLHALSDPVRLQIVRDLDERGASSCGTFAVPVAKSTLSHHLRVMRDAGLTWTEPAGTSRVVSLRRDDLDARFPGLLDAVLTAAPVAVPAG
jgi:DNA-binding transcriptional ArsR family regulator